MIGQPCQIEDHLSAGRQTIGRLACHAIKQLYASHYFHTTLELRFLVEDERRADRRGFYLLSISRSRIDGTSGLKGSLLRPVISRRSRNAVHSYLEHLKRQVERADPAIL